MAKLSIDDIVDMINACEKKRIKAVVGDVIFTASLSMFDNPKVVYYAIFGKTDDDQLIEDYINSEKIKIIKKTLRSKIKKNGDLDDKLDDISFDENKAYMLKIKKETEAAIEKGEIEKKDGLKILADITTRLNDKFKVIEKQDEQRVIVNAKFNHICEWTRRECFLQTKEYAMEHWDLVEADESKEKSTGGKI